MERGKVTSFEVARLAGVSQSAVSRTFTPGASVSARTREKVERAAAKLGYRPNPIARAMITGKSKIIGLVVSYLENQFYPIALELLSRALQRNGYHILIFIAENSERSVPGVVRELLDYQVDAIVTASVAMSNDLTAQCDAAGIPVVMFNRGQDDERLTSVTCDNYAGGRDVANFLLASGHRRIAHIAGWQESSTGRDRARGFVDALGARGIEPVAFADARYDADEAKRCTREIFSRTDRPDAVFVGNDHMAFAVLDTLRFELGLRVPEDVSVVGFDDVPIASWPAYDLTTIRQPVNRMVDATVEALIQRIEGATQPKHIQIGGPLIIRGTARKPEVFN